MRNARSSTDSVHSDARSRCARFLVRRCSMSDSWCLARMDTGHWDGQLRHNQIAVKPLALLASHTRFCRMRCDSNRSIDPSPPLQPCAALPLPRDRHGAPLWWLVRPVPHRFSCLSQSPLSVVAPTACTKLLLYRAHSPLRACCPLCLPSTRSCPRWATPR